MRWVAGADGCKAGWSVVLRPVEGDAPMRVRLFASFAALLAAEPDLVALAIDMPIAIWV